MCSQYALRDKFQGLSFWTIDESPVVFKHLKFSGNEFWLISNIYGIFHITLSVIIIGVSIYISANKQNISLLRITGENHFLWKITKRMSLSTSSSKCCCCCCDGVEQSWSSCFEFIRGYVSDYTKGDVALRKTSFKFVASQSNVTAVSYLLLSFWSNKQFESLWY